MTAPVKTFIVVAITTLLAWAFFYHVGKAFSEKPSPPVWYCIDGKIYEKITETYVSVVPPRTCLNTDTD